MDDFLSHISQEVSRASHQVGFAIGPAAETTTLEHLDFVPLDGGKVLVVLVAAGGQVSHKVIEPSDQYRPGRAAAGRQLSEQRIPGPFDGRGPRLAVIERLREERTLYDELMARALRLAISTFDDVGSAPIVFIQGTSLLLEGIGSEDPEVTIETLRTLLRMIEEKTRLVQLLDDYLGGEGITVVIGSEHPTPDLRRFSVIAATYSGGGSTGAVGVIGPTRMKYSRAINAVDTLSQAINRMTGRSDV